MGRQIGVKQCCCGCTLKTGSIIIGALTAINGFLGIYVSLHNMHGSSSSESVWGGQVTVALTVILACCHIGMGVLLIIGADKNRPHMVRPWILFSYFKLGMDIMAAVVTVYMLVTAAVDFGTMAFVLILMHLALAVEIYCIVVVHSFYKELLGSENVLPIKEQI